MAWLLAVVGFALGAIIAYLWTDRRCRVNQTNLEAQLKVAELKCQEQQQLLDAAEERLRDAFSALSAEALAKNNEAFLQLAKEKFAHARDRSRRLAGGTQGADRRPAQADAARC